MAIKKIKSIIAVVLLMNAYLMFAQFEISVYADRNNEKGDNSEFLKSDNFVFTDDREKYNNINRKIEEEISTYTQLINPDIEKYLNENGVYDSEIMQISDVELINNIKQGDIQIFTGFFAFDDTPETVNVPITDDELKPLSSNEIDALFGNVYYGENNKIFEQKEMKNSAIDKILLAIGIKPINAYAETYERGGGKETYLKKTLIAYPQTINGEACIKLTYFATWETMPKYRNVDVVSLYWTNATCESYLQSKTVVEQSWNYETHSCMDGPNIIINKKTGWGATDFSFYANPGDLRKSQYFVSSNGIVAAVKLHENTDTKITLQQRVYDEKIYSNEEVRIEVYLLKEKNKKDAQIYPYYQHYKSKADVKKVMVSAVGVVGNILSGDIVKAVYVLANGLQVTNNMDYSGVTFVWTYTFK